jgi:hypothetical protein
VAGHIRGTWRRSAVVPNGHERSSQPQVSGQMAPSAILDVEEVTAGANHGAASGSLSTDWALLGRKLNLATLA